MRVRPSSLLLSPAKAGAYLGIGRTKLLQLEASGRIKSKSLDGRRFFLTGSLLAFTDGLPDYKEPAPSNDNQAAMEALLAASVAERLARGKRGRQDQRRN
jgi:hypothetical protein